MALPLALLATLDALGPQLAVLRGDWWLIGSAAMALLGVEGLTVGDVDLLAEPDDATALLAALGVAAAPGTASDRFRSDRFGRWTGAPLPVEVMGGFHVRAGDGWTRLQLRSRQAVTVGAHRYFAPSAAEMIEICELFGRAKDRERAAGLRALGV